MAIISLKKPGAAIGLLICMYGIETFLQVQSAFFIDNRTYINISIGVVVLIAASASLLRRPITRDKLDWVQILTFSLFGFGFLSVYWTSAPEEFFRWRSAIPYYGVFLVLAPIITREEKALQEGFKWALIIGIPLLVLTAFFCEWGNRGLVLAKAIIENKKLVRESPPLAIASLGSVIGIIALVTHIKIKPSIVFRLAVLSLGIYIAFLTESRGQVLAIIVVAAFVYPIANRATNLKGMFVTFIGFAAFGAIVYFLVSNLELIRWRQDRIEQALSGRQEMWEYLFNEWIGSKGLPLLAGFGISSSFDMVGTYPHNLSLEILIELGIIGFAIYIAILLKSLSNSLNLLAKLEDYPAIRGDVITLIGLMGVSFALSFKEGSLYTWAPFFFYMICLSQQVPLTSKTIRKKTWLKSLFLQQQQPAYDPTMLPPTHPALEPQRPFNR